jgi:hypothetical protein
MLIYSNKASFIDMLLAGSLCLGAVLGCTSRSRSTEPAPTNGVRVTATDLIRQYESNEVAADNQYKGKALAVSGTIEKVGKDIMDAPYVTMRSERFAFSSAVYVRESARSSTFEVTTRGKTFSWWASMRVNLATYC